MHPPVRITVVQQLNLNIGMRATESNTAVSCLLFPGKGSYCTRSPDEMDAATGSGPLPPLGSVGRAKRTTSWTGRSLSRPKPANRRGPTVGTSLTITLSKETAETRWGVMPGLLDGVVAVFALDPSGIAKHHLRPCDQILHINGAPVTCHVRAVEMINEAHAAASVGGVGCTLEIIRPIESPGVKPQLQQIEVTLLKHTPDTLWGVMPGRLPGGQLVVHSLNRKGSAGDVLMVGDRLITIDGTLVKDEAHVVELINAAHARATPTSGAVINLVRLNDEGGYIGFKDVVTAVGFAGLGGAREAGGKLKTAKLPRNQKGVYAMEATLGAALGGPL
tara:strand:+ start:1746 stop:2744 length:999 start_codon:yes stop_codon:yes gene_type:complete